MSYSIKQIGKLAGISIRTLHYYDEIGLLSPARERSNDYRRYSDADLIRLQQILIYRELGMPLDQIKRILASPAWSPGSPTFSSTSIIPISTPSATTWSRATP